VSVLAELKKLFLDTILEVESPIIVDAVGRLRSEILMDLSIFCSGTIVKAQKNETNLLICRLKILKGLRKAIASIVVKNQRQRLSHLAKEDLFITVLTEQTILWDIPKKIVFHVARFATPLNSR